MTITTNIVEFTEVVKICGLHETNVLVYLLLRLWKKATSLVPSTHLNPPTCV